MLLFKLIAALLFAVPKLSILSTYMLEIIFNIPSEWL